MSEIMKRRSVNKLIEDIKILNATDFEELSNKFIRVIFDEELIHRGLDLNGKPAKGTVDSLNLDLSVIAEYSTDKKYFNKPYNKILSDIKHAQNYSGDLKRLYLCSNLTCKVTEFADLMLMCVENLRAGIDFKLLDARYIAERVYEEVGKKSELFAIFEEYLPSLKPMLDDYEYEYCINNVPEDYIYTVKEKDVLALLAKETILVVHGISGSGKSYLLRAVVNRLRDYENIFWINGSGISAESSFMSMQINRFGTTSNIAGRFNTTRTLLVIDGLDIGIASDFFSELEAGFVIGSKVLISSAGTIDALPKYHLDRLENECAKSILINGLPDESYDDSSVEYILKESGNHPLLLAIIRDTIKSENVKLIDIINDITPLVQYEDDVSKETLLKRVLLSKSTGLEDYLKVLKWLNVKIFDIDFLRHIIGIGGVKKLKQRSLLKEEDNELLVMHDMIALCVQGLDNTEDFEAKMFTYFAERVDCANYHFQRSLHLNAKKIVYLVSNSERKPDILHYLYFLLDVGGKDIDIIATIAQMRLADYVDNVIAMEVIIEAREKYRYFESLKEELNKYDQSTIDEIEEIMISNDFDIVTMHKLFHHQGKAYKRLKQDEEALGSFIKALELDINALHTRLQISRLVDKDDKVPHIKHIFSSYIGAPSEVALTVILATIEEAGKLKNVEDCMPEGYSFIEFAIELINLSLVENYDQPFVALAGLGRNAWFNHPDQLIELADKMPLPDSNIIDKRSLFGVAETMKSIAKANIESNNQEEFDRWLLLAEPYYLAIIIKNDFERTQIADYWILRNDGKKAIELLDGIDESRRNEFYYFQASKAYFCLKNFDSALSNIDEAIKVNNKFFLSTFISLKGDILVAASDLTQAVDMFEQAYELCENVKFKDKIKNKIDSIR